MSQVVDPSTSLRPFRVFSGTLSVALVLAIIEVLVRYGTADQAFSAPQLTLAVMSNVALLGLAAVCAVCVGWVLGWLLSLPARRFRRHVQTALIAALGGGLAGILANQTCAFGLSDLVPHPQANIGLAGLLGIAVALAVWRMGLSPHPSLMNLTRACVILAWMACAAATFFGVHRTDRFINQWVAKFADVRPSGDAGSSGIDDERGGQQGSAPNFLLIVLDTLRADRVGAYGKSKLTPHLDRLAQSGVVYEQAISTAPWTLPSHASMLTGLYPDEHGVNWGHYRLGEQPAMLPELLRPRGYATFAISNNHLLNEANGFARGFDAFLETTRDASIGQWKLALRCGAAQCITRRFGLSPDAGWDQGSAWTNWLLARTFDQLRRSPRPFFAMLNYFEPHDPYLPPRRFLEEHLTTDERRAACALPQGEQHLAAHACGGAAHGYRPEQVTLMSKLYDAEVAYQDEIIGELMGMLERTDLLSNTWVVVTSDHGELFGEWEMVYHTAGAHYQLLHVPLIVRSPRDAGGVRVASPVQPVDIFMTVLREAGAPAPAGVTRAYPLPSSPDDQSPRKFCVAQTHGASIAGLSITQRLNQQADLSHWLRWIHTVYKDGYILQTDTNGDESLYHVAADPGMAVNLAEARTNLVETMLAELHDWSSGKSGEEIINDRPKHAEAGW